MEIGFMFAVALYQGNPDMKRRFWYMDQEMYAHILPNAAILIDKAHNLKTKVIFLVI
jgi:hypothetical protein